MENMVVPLSGVFHKFIGGTRYIFEALEKRLEGQNSLS
jgi:hypothetical protein